MTFVGRLRRIFDPGASVETLDGVRAVLREHGRLNPGESIAATVREVATWLDEAQTEICDIDYVAATALHAVGGRVGTADDDRPTALEYVRALAGAAKGLAGEKARADAFAADNAAKAEEIVRLHSEAAEVRRLYGELERSHAQLREAHESLRRRSEAGSVDARKLRRRWAEVCDIVNRPMDGE